MKTRRRVATTGCERGGWREAEGRIPRSLDMLMLRREKQAGAGGTGGGGGGGARDGGGGERQAVCFGSGDDSVGEGEALLFSGTEGEGVCGGGQEGRGEEEEEERKMGTSIGEQRGMYEGGEVASQAFWERRGRTNNKLMYSKVCVREGGAVGRV